MFGEATLLARDWWSSRLVTNVIAFKQCNGNSLNKNDELNYIRAWNTVSLNRQWLNSTFRSLSLIDALIDKTKLTKNESLRLPYEKIEEHKSYIDKNYTMLR